MSSYLPELRVALSSSEQGIFSRTIDPHLWKMEIKGRDIKASKGLTKSQVSQDTTLLIPADTFRVL